MSVLSASRKKEKKKGRRQGKEHHQMLQLWYSAQCVDSKLRSRLRVSCLVAQSAVAEQKAGGRQQVNGSMAAGEWALSHGVWGVFGCCRNCRAEGQDLASLLCVQPDEGKEKVIV